MKKLLLAFLLSLIFTAPSYGGMVIGSGAAATPQWYYSAGSDNYPNGQTLSTLDNVGGPITLASGGTITKIAIKIGTTAPENMKIGLYRLVVATWTLVECVTLAYPSANAWAEATLVTPYVTSVGQTVRVIASFDASWSAFYGSATAGTGFWYTNDYNTCCVSTPTMTDDSQWSAAIYY